MIDALRRQYWQSATNILAVSSPLAAEWTDLERWRECVALSIDDARDAVSGLTSDSLRRYAAFAASDGVVTAEEVATFRRAAGVVGAPPWMAASASDCTSTASDIS